MRWRPRWVWLGPVERTWARTCHASPALPPPLPSSEGQQRSVRGVVGRTWGWQGFGQGVSGPVCPALRASRSRPPRPSLSNQLMNNCFIHRPDGVFWVPEKVRGRGSAAGGAVLRCRCPGWPCALSLRPSSHTILSQALLPPVHRIPPLPPRRRASGWGCATCSSRTSTCGWRPSGLQTTCPRSTPVCTGQAGEGWVGSGVQGWRGEGCLHGHAHGPRGWDGGAAPGA